MTVTVETGDPRHPEARALLQASHDLMAELFPPDQCHILNVDELAQDDVRFFVAKSEGQIVGTGAIALRRGYAEVKSMYVSDAARGKGVAARILNTLLETARAEGCPLVRLETGDLLTAACRLYERHGFQRIPPFGCYKDDPHSIYYERAL